MDFDWATFLGGLLGALTTAASVFYAAKQIKTATEDQRRNEGWRRADSARVLVERLSTDEELAFCGRALDWGVGPLIIPAKYLPLFPKDVRVIEHKPDLMARALAINLASDWRAPEALTYRYCFDDFFSYIDQLRIYVQRDLICRSDLIGLEYYLDLIRSPPYFDNKCVHENVFISFMQRFYPELQFFVLSGDIVKTGAGGFK